MKKQIKLYLHSSKESMRDSFGDALGLDEDEKYGDNEVLDKLAYALYEVEFDVEFDTETGDYEILKVDGMELVDDEEV